MMSETIRFERSRRFSVGLYAQKYSLYYGVDNCYSIDIPLDIQYIASKFRDLHFFSAIRPKFAQVRLENNRGTCNAQSKHA
jgi:hypothetical protein